MCENTRQGLRKLVEIIALPRGQREEMVYPKGKVYDFFTVDQIKRLGACRCKQRGCCFLASQAKPPKIFTDEIVLKIRERFTSALGLLVSLEKYFDTLIFDFIEKDYCDERLAKAPLTKDELTELLLNASGGPDEDLTFDVRKFHILQHEFFLPQLTYKSPHSSIGMARSLPFSVGKVVGKGAYSIVYEAQMLHEYHDFPDIKDGRIAVKTYTDWSEGNGDCNKERENNERWDSHDYIMPLQASLDHREIYMTIYPLAKHDLRELLQKDPPEEYSQDPKKAWKRFVNLLSALKHIHSSKPEIYGYHFDIKPHNILVRFDGDWAITDLGLAYWKANDTGISETSRREGNERYGAPEARPHRNYDIWAMGCIGCEIIAWLDRGAPGVEQFRKERGLKHEGVTLDNFHHNQKLKAPVTRLLEQVRGDDGFSKDVANILRKMLEIDPAQRLDASAAEELFKKVLGMRPPEPTSRRTSIQGTPLTLSPRQTMSRRPSLNVYIPSERSNKRNSKSPLLSLEDNFFLRSQNEENTNPNVPQIQVTGDPDDSELLDPKHTVEKLLSPIRMSRQALETPSGGWAKRPLSESPVTTESKSTFFGGESALHKRLKTVNNTGI